MNANRISCYVNAETSWVKMASHRLTIRDNSQLSLHYVETSVLVNKCQNLRNNNKSTFSLNKLNIAWNGNVCAIIERQWHRSNVSRLSKKNGAHRGVIRCRRDDWLLHKWQGTPIHSCLWFCSQMNHILPFRWFSRIFLCQRRCVKNAFISWRLRTVSSNNGANLTNN